MKALLLLLLALGLLMGWPHLERLLRDLRGKNSKLWENQEAVRLETGLSPEDLAAVLALPGAPSAYRTDGETIWISRATAEFVRRCRAQADRGASEVARAVGAGLIGAAAQEALSEKDSDRSPLDRVPLGWGTNTVAFPSTVQWYRPDLRYGFVSTPIGEALVTGEILAECGVVGLKDNEKVWVNVCAPPGQKKFVVIFITRRS